jgi:hypothetical protein
MKQIISLIVNVTMLFILGVIILLGGSIAESAAVPQSINYQAVLLDSNSDPITTPVDIVFTIYDDSTGGNILWQETKTGVDPDDNGQFSLVLGKTVPISDNVLLGGMCWLGIKVGMDAEISPRTEMVSSAYSFRVSTVDQANAGTIYGPLTISESQARAADAKLQLTCGAKAPDTIQIDACGGVILRATNQIGQEVLSATINQGNQEAELSIRVDGGNAALLNAYGMEFHNNVAKGDRALQKKYVYGVAGFQHLDDNGTDILGEWTESAPGQTYIGMTDYSAKAAGASLKIRPPSADLAEVFTVNTSTGDPSFQLQTNPSGITSMSFENPSAKISDRLLINNDGIFFLNAAKSETLMTITAAGNVHGKGQISMGANAIASEYTTTLGPFNQALNETCVVIGVNNKASDFAAAVVSGLANISAGRASAIGGGSNNETQMRNSAIAGGANNITFGEYNAVGGGNGNVAGLAAKGPGADPKLDEAATVGGGLGNTASGAEATVSGGTNNIASGSYSTVSGGTTNSATNVADVVAGGSTNTASGGFSAVGGGALNNASGNYSVVAGGSDNIAGNRYSTVGGGKYGRAGGQFSTVGGGGGDDSVSANQALGHYSTVPGGRANVATGDNSFAAGRRAKADHAGVFIWGDNTDSDFASTATNQFLVRAGNGVGINVNNPSEDLDVNGNARLRGIPSTVTVYNTVMADGNGKLWTLSAKSSRRYKENIRDLGVDPANVLQLDPVRFSWKETGQEDMGLIAEEVAKLIPELAIYDKENRPDGVKYDKVVLYLLAALKDLKAENDALKAHQTNTDLRLSQLEKLVETVLAKQSDTKSGGKLSINR